MPRRAAGTSLTEPGIILDLGRKHISGNAAEFLNNQDVRKAYLGV
jgi:ABC-type branched-subunit amino acid transport system ATPase component